MAVEEELVGTQKGPGTTEPENVDPSPRAVLDVMESGTESEHGSSSCSCDMELNDLMGQNRPNTQQLQLLRDTCGYGVQWKGTFETMMKKSVKRFSTLPMPLMATYDGSKKSMKRKLARIPSAGHAIDCEGIRAMKPSLRCFGFKELADATDDFNEENLLGKGGHAEVYKGRLSDGQIVAVKRLMNNDKQEEKWVRDFLSELGIITHINHLNSAHVLGFGVDGGLYLVLQFSPHGSLESLLHGSEQSLSWSIRFKVASGVAQGLKYLHHDCQRRIIHRDIKPSNILLTKDYEAMLSDFGIAKWLPDKWGSHVVYNLEGTFGYLAPEYFMHGLVNEKTDVFAYGVLLLEIITGRHAVDSSRQSLVMWAKPLLDSNNFKKLVDPRLGDDYDVTELKRAMVTASLCIHHLSDKRPHMNLVVELLKGDDDLKQKPTSGRSSLPDGWDLEDHTCSAYLQVISRHKELALE